MDKSIDPLWTQLTEHNLVSGEEPSSKELSSPWYIKLLLAFSGWLAALFLLLFISAGLTVIFKSTIASIVLSTLLFVLAFVIFKNNKNDF